MTIKVSPKSAKVIDFFSHKAVTTQNSNNVADALRLVRLSPECDGLGMLYGNDTNPGKLFSLKILAWGLQADGEVVGLVPWLNKITPCPELTDSLNGRWEGYYNADNGDVFYQAPEHKKLELEAALKYYGTAGPDPTGSKAAVAQEIPDTIGTHAVLAEKGNRQFKIVEVFSWQLDAAGDIHGMLIDKNRVHRTPVLTGDQCLYRTDEDPRFKYYFQYSIANKVKERDPDALEAIALLIDH